MKAYISESFSNRKFVDKVNTTSGNPLKEIKSATLEFVDNNSFD